MLSTLVPIGPPLPPRTSDPHVSLFSPQSRLETHRYHNVRNLTVAAAQFALDNASWVRHVFWTPGVRGLDDLEISATPSAAESTEKDNSPVNATAFVREMPASQRLAASTFTLLTYMRSHFCFQPPGADGAPRSSVAPSALAAAPIVFLPYHSCFM